MPISSKDGKKKKKSVHLQIFYLHLEYKRLIYSPGLGGPVTFMISCIDPALPFECKTPTCKSKLAFLDLMEPNLQLGCRTQHCHQPQEVTTSWHIRTHHQPGQGEGCDSHGCDGIIFKCKMLNAKKTVAQAGDVFRNVRCGTSCDSCPSSPHHHALPSHLLGWA